MEHRIGGKSGEIDPDDIDKKIQNGDSVIVQFSESAQYDNDVLLDKLDQLCAKHGERLNLRFYSHYPGKPFDFRILLKIPHLKSLAVDCMDDVKNIQILIEFKDLKKLTLVVFRLKETEILKFLNCHNLKDLSLGPTALNLEYLNRFENLTKLFLAGHKKNIEAIGELAHLESLSLASLGGNPVSFINRLKRLKRLSFLLGGRENINEIEGGALEYLGIDRVRGFNDVGDISRFHQLKHFSISDNIRLPGIRFDKKLPSLEVLRIENCKTLSFIDGIEKLSSLKHMWIFKTKLDFENLIRQELPSSLKNFSFHTSRKKENNNIQSRLRIKGYEDYSWQKLNSDYCS